MVDGESVRLLQPHHASKKGRSIAASLANVSSLYARGDRRPLHLREAQSRHALPGAGQANTSARGDALERAHSGRIGGITYPKSSYRLPWSVLRGRPGDGLMPSHINSKGPTTACRISVGYALAEHAEQSRLAQGKQDYRRALRQEHRYVGCHKQVCS